MIKVNKILMRDLITYHQSSLSLELKTYLELFLIIFFKKSKCKERNINLR